MNVKLGELIALQERIDGLRTELGISPPGIIFSAPLNAINDGLVIVEADGQGGGTASVVDGNYPVDYVTKYLKVFPTEPAARAAAEEIVFNGCKPVEVLDAS